MNSTATEQVTRESMNETMVKSKRDAKRWVFYPFALLVVSGLVWSGYFYQPEPDVAQLLSSAHLLAQCGALDDAEVNCRKALEREPRNMHGWLIQGFIEERRGAFAAARECYDRAMEINVDRELGIDIALSAVDVTRRAGDFAVANERLDRMEEREGAIGKSKRLRGVIALDEHRWNDALSLFDDAKRLGADVPELDRLCAQAYVGMKRFDLAMATLESQTNEQKKCGPMYCLVARRSIEDGDVPTARLALQRLRQSDKHAAQKLGRDPFWRERLTREDLRDVMN